MGYPSSVDSGGVSPAIIATDWSQAGSVVTTTYTANQVQCFSFDLQAPTVITGARWHMGATATGSTNVAIYTLSGGALVSGSDTGAITNVANSDVSATYTTPISLAPGQYLAALASSNGTDTYMARNSGSANKAWHNRVATNTMSASVMPSTLGTLNATLSNPSFCLLTQGGLS